MIRVNLIGGPKKAAAAKSGISLQVPTAILPLVWVGLVVGATLYGYSWYSDLVGQQEQLGSQISAAQAQIAQLQSVIDADALYEQRKQMLEDRIAAIEDLQRNQMSPVVTLDILSQAISPTEYVWLNQLGQNESQVTMSGVGTSLNAIADFETSLEDTGYFRNIVLANAQDSQGLFTFSMSCEFTPPLLDEDEESENEEDSGDEASDGADEPSEGAGG
jgi:Tfp pilus assembly protein PilN